MLKRDASTYSRTSIPTAVLEARRTPPEASDLNAPDIETIYGKCEGSEQTSPKNMKATG